jgi:hypothetical protein
MTDRPQEPVTPADADYLEEAAAELRKARAANDRRFKDAAASGNDVAAELREVSAEYMRIATAFTFLAAIKQGLLPPEMAPVNEADQEGGS